MGGNTKTVMCANAGPAGYNCDESLSTLRYANRAKNIKNRPVINEDPKDTKLREYQEEIARLKERLGAMPTSSSDVPAVNEADRDAILEECRSNASKESAQIIAKTEAERAALQQKLDAEVKAREDTENQRITLEKQLARMEAELMIGGEMADEAAKQEAARVAAERELIARKESQMALARKMEEQAEEKLELEEKYGSLAEEVASKTRKLKKIWRKYQQAKNEIKDLEHEIVQEKNDILDSVRETQKQLKLKEFIISNFIPPKVTVTGIVIVVVYFCHQSLTPQTFASSSVCIVV